MEVPFNIGEKVQTALGAVGVVEVIDTDNDGQPVVLVRWKSGAVGSYTKEDIKRYKILKA